MNGPAFARLLHHWSEDEVSGHRQIFGDRVKLKSSLFSGVGFYTPIRSFLGHITF